MFINIVSEVKDTIFDSKIDNAIDYLDISLEKIADNEVLKSLPIVSKCYQFAKTAISVREWFLVKKIIVFAENLQRGKISDSDIKKYKSILEKNPKRMYKELEYILVIIDAQLECEKIKYYANLYAAVINTEEIFNWYDFRFMVDILNRFSIYDVNAICDLYEKETYRKEDIYDFIAMKRLSSIGLVDYIDEKYAESETIASLNGLGKKFFEVCIKPN